MAYIMWKQHKICLIVLTRTQSWQKKPKHNAPISVWFTGTKSGTNLEQFHYFSFAITKLSFQTRNLGVGLLKQPLLHALSLCEPSADHVDPSWDLPKIMVIMHLGSQEASGCYSFSYWRSGQTLQNSLQHYQQCQGQARVVAFCLLATQQ